MKNLNIPSNTEKEHLIHALPLVNYKLFSSFEESEFRVHLENDTSVFIIDETIGRWLPFINSSNFGAITIQKKKNIKIVKL